MTFLQLQDAVMAQLNLTSADARARIRSFLNQRYREVQSSVNLARTRRGTVNFTTANGVSTSTATGIAKVLGVNDPTNRKRPLTETTLAQIREKDPDASTTGYPEEYAITAHGADTVTLHLWPTPTSTETLVADALLAGTEMDDDTDEPTIPADFHDILVRGAKADELMRMEKLQPLAREEERKFEKRLSDLRYFMAKSAYLSTRQTDWSGLAATGRQVWPYGGRLVT